MAALISLIQVLTGMGNIFFYTSANTEVLPVGDTSCCSEYSQLNDWYKC